MSKKLVTFITVGYPNLNSSIKYINELIELGVDIIELGLPFSDPIVSNEILEKADIESLNNGVTVDDIFTIVKSIQIEYYNKNKKYFKFVLKAYLNTAFSDLLKNCPAEKIDLIYKVAKVIAED